MSLILEALVLIVLVLLCFFLLGIVIPVSYTLGTAISDKVECFLCNL